jgi:Flp pilus assembly protein TadG
VDAAGLAGSIVHRNAFAKSESGAAAVEFALVLPSLAMLIVGTLYVGLVMYSAAGLHSAVEAAARCYSVDSIQCGSPSATQTYGAGRFYGVSTPTFTASLAACGHLVIATLSIDLSAGLAHWSIPLSASSCFP